MKHIAIIFFTLLSLPLQANERWYQIELLIFANNSAQGLIGERWRQPNLEENTETLPVELPGTISTPPPTPRQVVASMPLTLEDAIIDSSYSFESVTESDKQLLDSAAKMRKHWQYRPLLYSAWRQGFKADAAAIPVYLNNETIVKEASPFSQSVAEFSQRFGDGFSSEDIEPSSDQSIYELSGTAAVTLKRYLHLELKLNYNRLMNSQDKEQVRAIYQSLETDYLSFNIDESRRMRSTQAHYFDHPTFGVIALITPVDTTSAEATPNKQLEIETLPTKEDSAATTTPLQ